MDGVLPEGIPPGYGENTLVLMVQKVTVLFAYWEMSQAAREFLKERQTALRLCSLAEGRYLPYVTVSPTFLTGNWYFERVTPGKKYRCELGWWDNGDFYPLMCSQPVDVPTGAITLRVTGRGKRRRGKKVTASVGAVSTVGVSSGVTRRP